MAGTMLDLRADLDSFEKGDLVGHVVVPFHSQVDLYLFILEDARQIDWRTKAIVCTIIWVEICNKLILRCISKRLCSTHIFGELLRLRLHVLNGTSLEVNQYIGRSTRC